MLNAASRDIILLQEILSYLGESLEGMDVPERPEDEAGGTLYKVLNMANMKRDVVVRVNDLRKLVNGAQHELQNLSSMTDVINTKQLEDVFKSVEANTKFLVDASGANERSSASLQVLPPPCFLLTITVCLSCCMKNPDLTAASADTFVWRFPPRSCK